MEMNTEAVPMEDAALAWAELKAAIQGGRARLIPAVIGGVAHTAIVEVSTDGQTVTALYAVLARAKGLSK